MGAGRRDIDQRLSIERAGGGVGRGGAHAVCFGLASLAQAVCYHSLSSRGA